MEARQQWVSLCSRSFDADTQTLLQMGLMLRMCLLIEQYLGILCDPGTGAKYGYLLKYYFFIISIKAF